MKVRRLLLSALVCAGAALAGTAPAEPDARLERFLRAGAAFDQGDYAAAIDEYRGLIEDGWVSAPLLYNLGNALYRQGDTGQAVLHYRRAWRLTPRDADIRDNLGRALERTQALPPDPNPIEQTACLLPRAAWVGIAAAAYWGLALLLCLSFFLPRAKPWLQAAGGPGWVTLAAALAAIWVWSYGRPGNEYVILADGQQALYAPLENAQPHFDLPAGSIVTGRESAPGWLRVSLGGASGWIPESVCTRVDDAPYL